MGYPITTSLSGTASTTVSTQTFTDEQDALSLTNAGSYDIYFNAGEYTNVVIHPTQTWSNTVDYTTLDIWTTSGTATYTGTATNNGTTPATVDQLLQLLNTKSDDYVNDTVNFPFYFNAINSGTRTWDYGTSKHPGIERYLSSTTANSGIASRLAIGSIQISGGEKFTCVFQTPASQNTITRRMGFHDTADVTAPTDGVLATIADGTLYGRTAAAGIYSTTPSTYTLSNSTWYRIVISLNSDATKATFTLYADDSSTVLWTDSVSTNIPTAAGQATGCGDVCTSSGTTAIVIGYIDYMSYMLPNARRVM